MNQKIDVLDHGYIALVESWGSDERIVEAARMSTGKGFNGWGGEFVAHECDKCGYRHLLHDAVIRVGSIHVPPFGECGGSFFEYYTPPGDEKLLKYLYSHGHMTPFEMAGVTLEIEAPIFVFREWHRHRTQSYNEMSARYTPMPDVNYIPSVERLMLNAAGTNKQAGTIVGAEALTQEMSMAFQECLEDSYAEAEQFYQDSLKKGVPKELARLCLPVGRYSRMRASANLRNWLQFLTLRMDVAAQWEIRQYANAVGSVVAGLFPRTWALFSKQVL